MENDKKSNANVVKSYVRYLKLERNYSRNTIDAYERDLQRLLDYCRAAKLDPLAVKLEDLQHFSATLHDRNVTPKSQARILSGVRSFYRYLLVDGYIEADPSELLESPQLGVHLPEVLTTDEVDRLEDSIDLSVAEGQRNKAIIEVLFSCGLRVTELVNLKCSNVYMEEKFIRVEGKGKKERLVPISAKAVKEIELWYLDRVHLDITAGEED